MRLIFIALATLALAASSVHARPNRVLELDGDGDYVELPSEPFAHLRQATVEGWFQWAAWRYFSQPWGYGTPDSGMMFNQEVSAPTVKFFVYAAGGLHLTRAVDILKPGEWIHLAAVTGPGGIEFYVDGVLVDGRPYEGSFADLGIGLHALGRAHWEDNPDFKGRIDEVRIWDHRRSAAAIRDGMHRRLRGDEPGLLSLWSFDDGDARDAGPLQAHGRLRGDASTLAAASPRGAGAPAVLHSRIVDREGRPLSKAEVRVLEGDEIVARQMSGPDGWVHIVLRPPSTPVDISVFLFQEAGTWDLGVQLAPGQILTRTYTPEGAAQLSGVVRLRGGGELGRMAVQLVRAAPGGGVPPATQRPVETLQAMTSGAFRFATVRPGIYYLRCYTADGFVYYGQTASGEAPVAIRVDTGDHLQDLDLLLPRVRRGVVRGHSFVDGLVHGEVNDILVSRDGTVWFATAGGLSQFDGESFRNYTRMDGLPAARINGLAEDDGGLWIATESGLARFDGERFASFDTSAGLAHSRVVAVAADGAGGVWAGTQSGLSHFDGEGFRNLGVADGLVNDRVLDLLVRRDGSLWVGTEGGLSRWREGDGFTNYTIADGLLRDWVSTLFEDDEGQLWLGLQQGGVARWDGESFHELTWRDGLGDMGAYAIAQDGRGYLWFGTASGPSRYDGTGFIVYPNRTYTYTEYVSALAVDPAGGLWVGNALGARRIDETSVVSYDVADGLGHADVTSATLDDEGRMWFTTGGGGLSSFDGRTWETVTSADGLVHNHAYDVMQAHDGALWVVTPYGSSRWDGHSFLNLEGDDGLISQGLDVTECRGAIWIATQANGVLRWTETGIDFLRRPQGLADEAVRAVHCDGRDRLWIGGIGRISIYDGEKVRALSEADGLPPGDVTAFLDGDDGAMWVGTLGGGLLSISGWPPTGAGDSLRIDRVTRRDGLAQDEIVALHRGIDGFLWAGTTHGGLAFTDGRAWSSVDTRDGLLSDYVKDVVQGADGSIWVATSLGLSRFRRDAHRPKVRVTSLRSDQGLLDPAMPAPLETGRRLTVDFSAVDLKTYPEKRQYTWRVAAPGDSATPWSPPSRQATVEWTPSRAGKQVFEVRAIDRDLNYSEPARLPLTIVLPWYQRATVAGPAAAGALMLLLSAAGFSWRYGVQRREARRLRERLLAQEREERERLEDINRDLHAARRAAEAASQAKSTFLANMSHEIRTPLNSILGYAQILQRRKGLDADLRRSVETIEGSGTHLLSLINGILDLSKIEAGREELQITEFDVGVMVRNLASMFQPACQRKGLTWSAELPEDLRRVRGDEGKLRQVLINLLGNATKFTLAGGVALRIERVAESLRCSVTDTGPGIDAEGQEHIFAPFEQADGAEGTVGTGLGLAIARRHVELMGGWLQVESRPGAGACFFFDIALDEVGAEPQTATVSRRVARLAEGQGLRILVIDDVEQNRTVLRLLLEDIGAEVCLAASGEEGLRLAANAPPDIVLTDIRMPGMDGEETMRALWAAHGRGRFPIIAVSASVLQHERRHYLDAGFDAFLTKPVNAEELFACLAERAGVTYAYAEIEADTPGTDVVDIDIPADLRRRIDAALDVQSLTQLRQALAELASRGDGEAAFVDGLRPLVQQYRLDEVGDLLHHTGEEEAT